MRVNSWYLDSNAHKMPIISLFSCIYPLPKRTKSAKTRVFYTFTPCFHAPFLHDFVTPLKIFCDTIGDTIAKMHLFEHWKTEAVRSPFLCRFQAVFPVFRWRSAPVLSRVCPGLGRTRFDPVELFRFLRFSCIFSMSCIDIAHEKKRPFLSRFCRFSGRFSPNYPELFTSTLKSSVLFVSLSIRNSVSSGKRSAKFGEIHPFVFSFLF